MGFNRDLFDRVAALYDEKPPFFRRLATELVARAQIPDGSRVLDLGAGTGAATAAMCAACPAGSVTAVDIAPAMLDRLRALDLPGVTAVEADLARMPLSDGSFDHAVSGFTMHILGPAEAAAREIHRVVRAGGTLTWSMPGTHPDAVEWQGDYGKTCALVRRRGRIARPRHRRPPAPAPDPAARRSWSPRASFGCAGFDVRSVARTRCQRF